MKRNKMIARRLRAGRHTYSKAGKIACQHCQAITRASRDAATRSRPPEPVVSDTRRNVIHAGA